MLLVGEKRKTQEQIKAIMVMYGLEDFVVEEFKVYDNNVGGYVDDFVTASQRMVDNIYFIKNYDELEPEHDRHKQIAELIQFLRACKGSPVELRSTITIPKGCLIKNTEHHITIKEDVFGFGEFGELDLFLNTYLHYCSGGIIEKLPKKRDLFNPEWHKYFTEPYTDEEISKIIAYCEEREDKRIKPNYLGRLGYIAKHIIGYLKPETAKSNISDTKLYSFVYDVMLLGEPELKYPITTKGFSKGKAKEKSDKVKYWIKRFEEAKEKAEKEENK